MKKKHWWLVLICTLAFVLRVYRLAQAPPGFWFDESSFAYSAYSILKTGKDEFGQVLPVAFKAFGEYKMALYGYWLIPFIFIGGLNVFSVRLASAVLGVVGCASIYFLSQKLFKNKQVSLFSALIWAFSPLALQFNRLVYENNLTVVLLIWGVYFFINSLEKKKPLFWSLVFFILSAYTHLQGRVLAPLLLFSLTTIYFKKLKSDLKIIFNKHSLLALALVLPLVFYMVKGSAWKRAKATSFTSDQSVVLNIEKNLSYHSHPKPWRVFHNKLTGYSFQFIKNYLSHWSAGFWLFKGDPVKIYSTPNTGIILFWEAPFFILGLVKLFNKNKSGKVVLAWLTLGFVPSALSQFVPSANRSFSVLPAVVLISAVGLSWVFKKFKNKNLILLTLGFIFLVNLFYYFDNYYVHLPKAYQYEWRTGAKRVISEIQKTEKTYQRIVVDQELVNYINVLFFKKYPPQKVQNQAKLIDIDRFGFGFVPKIDKYEFTRNMPTLIEPDTLYVGECGHFSGQAQNPYQVQYQLPIVPNKKEFCLVSQK